jgi:hypothetical protein
LSRFDPSVLARSVIPAAARRILCRWYMPCIMLVSTSCLIPLPLHPEELRVPKILNPTPDDGAVEIYPGVETTIRAIISDPDTLIADLIVQWTVGDEDITYLSTQTPVGDPDPDGNQYDLSVQLDLDYNDELRDHDQDTIELYVSDHDNEVTATWLLTVLGDKP